MTAVANDYAEHQRRRWMRPDGFRWFGPARRWTKPEYVRSAADAVDRKYNPDQPRVPQGNPEGGRWTREAEGVDLIYERALSFSRRNRRMAITGPGNYQRCLEICYPLLERFQRPGSDRNQTDFFKCMNACVHGLRWR